MKKLIIKIPKVEGKKWSLQRKGLEARQYISAINLFRYLERVWPTVKFREKTVLVIKTMVDSQWTNINESLATFNPKYLLYLTGCFLEDFLSKDSQRDIFRRYSKHSNNA